MNTYTLTTLCLIAVLFFPFQAAAGDYKEVINPGSWEIPQLDALLARASRITDTPERSDFLSGQFTGIPYKAGTLIGNQHTPEELVINLSGVDCFTFIDYIEAMRRSETFTGFKENLRKVRYRNGVVDYKNRNHFFTDWIVCNAGFINDVTGQIGMEKSKKTVKLLNAAENGKPLLPGIAAGKREVTWIPAERIDDMLLDRLRTGDYLGIYSVKENLDVSHVGIVIREKAGIFIRHASSQDACRRVIDQDLRAYLVHKPGIVVLRPESTSH
jgi:hypothetical protein